MEDGIRVVDCFVKSIPRSTCLPGASMLTTTCLFKLGRAIAGNMRFLCKEERYDDL